MTTITIERAVLLRALEALRPATAPNGAKRDAAFEELRAALAAPATAPEQRMKELEAENEQLRNDAERMKKGLKAVEELIDQSSGVAGLHLNGDLASWSELRTGGCNEGWLLAFDEAVDAAPATAPAQPSWHDAPTVPGLWMNGINRHAQEVLQRHVDAGMLAEVNGQWFGPIPIPEDRQ